MSAVVCLPRDRGPHEGRQHVSRLPVSPELRAALWRGRLTSTDERVQTAALLLTGFASLGHLLSLSVLTCTMRVTVPLRVPVKVTQGSCLLAGPVPITRSCNYRGLTWTPITKPVCSAQSLLVSSAPQHSSSEGPPWCWWLLSPPAPSQHGQDTLESGRDLSGLGALRMQRESDAPRLTFWKQPSADGRQVVGTCPSCPPLGCTCL